MVAKAKADGGLWRLERPHMEEAVRVLAEAGSISAAARVLGITRQAFQNRYDQAVANSLARPRVESNPSRWRPGEEIVAARKAEFERVRNAGANRAGNVIHRPDDGPFMLMMLGDEHLDSPGTDLNLWERWIGYLDRSKHITGWSLGDMLDNWVKALAHLYGHSETPAAEGWILLEHYMDQIGQDLDGSVAGNHDKWGGGDVILSGIMEKHGVLHRADSLRVTYRCPGGREITVNARHTWPGRSMWSEVHGIKRAARMGVRDTILVGGHTHVSGESTERDPMNGRISFCYQVAAFKVVDDYADTLGFLDRHISPAVALVIDPRRADNDPELVKHFYDPAPAADYLGFLRRKPRAR